MPICLTLAVGTDFRVFTIQSLMVRSSTNGSKALSRLRPSYEGGVSRADSDGGARRDL